MHTPSSPDAIETLARKRAGAQLGWIVHASIYVAVNLFLAALSAHQGRAWALFPALGWGLGLLVHGAAVWLAQPGGTLYARLLARERTRLHSARPTDRR
ncbi:hypothetical protein B2J86_12500 [Acidovorax sp. SRB_14]|uniref:2TM domain-containing protein n=1 Tax=unclassified Acidovorax TaxID=2684926 RepID=UPI00145D6569|nr:MULTISPECIES: 2TM domain-containing protein [unclassified Acidovorax]NMM76126.1 hypothetical protein [Acidovorax sp. SRB_24]NMM81731.1 hypothetical protein [Acidovorax sp. SRB_14]NMM86470.1 hypothetical protein [Rhodococcus sp. SRB_17]